jgi:hypothetical protein
MPIHDAKLRLADAQALGLAADEYSTDEINFGVTTPAPNKSGKWGLHFVVTTAFTGCASGAIVWIVHGAATAPTTKHTGLFIPVANLVAGAHFFIPAGKGIDILQYARGLFDIVSEVTTAGNADMWFGPDDDMGDG